jgi:cytochrome c553
VRILSVLAFLPLAALAQPSGVEVCAGCHGARGEGDPAKQAPRLAGQPPAYLARQLAAYAEGSRVNPVMGPIAKQLAPEQRQPLAEHYAKLQAPPAKATSSGSERGRVLATRGDEAQYIQGCENCHGPGGTGLGNVIPYLSGLDSRYLEGALGEWKDGRRKTDPSQQMNLIGKSLSAADMKALAAYYASQPAPRTASATVQKPAAKPSGGKTRPGTATKPREGSGVSGGEPSGSQGPGGAGTK